MAKAPRIGRAKTRLAKSMGGPEAVRLARLMTQDLIRRMDRDPRWETWLAMSPSGWTGEGLNLPDGIPVMAQGGGDLGMRMQRVMEGLPPGPVLIVGSDIPEIAPRHISEGFRALGSHDAVIGAASDGGYWAIGLKRRPRIAKVFEGVRWSGPHARADTLANLARQGLSAALLATLDDVDTEEDLARWRARQRPASDLRDQNR